MTSAVPRDCTAGAEAVGFGGKHDGVNFGLWDIHTEMSSWSTRNKLGRHQLIESDYIEKRKGLRTKSRGR